MFDDEVFLVMLFRIKGKVALWCFSQSKTIFLITLFVHPRNLMTYIKFVCLLPCIGQDLSLVKHSHFVAIMGLVNNDNFCEMVDRYKGKDEKVKHAYENGGNSKWKSEAYYLDIFRCLMNQDEYILEICSYDVLIHRPFLSCRVSLWMHLDISTFVIHHRVLLLFWELFLIPIISNITVYDNLNVLWTYKMCFEYVMYCIHVSALNIFKNTI
jgi:hypothetical protein